MSSLIGWENILIDLNREVIEPNMAIRLWRDKKFWIQESLKLATELKASNYQLAIFTNSWLGLEDETNSDLLPDELSLFSHIVDSSKVGLRKPNPKFYKKLESIIGATNDKILLIDDTPINLRIAQSRGWQTFLFATNNNTVSTDKIRSMLA